MALLALLNQMMQELYLAILSHPFIFSLCLISVLLFLTCTTKSPSGKTINLPPSPPTLPLIGNLHQIGSHQHRSLGALSNKYGPLMLLHLGQVPTLVVSSADMVREIVKSHDVVFSSRPKTLAADILLYGCKDLAFSPYNEYWKQVRKICVFELLSLTRVQQFQFVREEETVLLVDKIRQACLTSNNRTYSIYSSINLSKMFATTSNNVISRCVIGQTLEKNMGPNCDVGGLLRSVMVYLMAFSVGDLFPPLRCIDVLRGFIGRLKATFRALDQSLDLVIEERKAMIRESGGEMSSSSKDFVDILLQLQKDALPGFKLSLDNLKGILLDMFLGGTSTTSAALEWIMSELIRNPRVMKKAQEEVRSVVGKKSKIDTNDINQMDYLKCVIKETLRLHPPAPLGGPRETIDQSVEMGGYHIPGKIRVLINAWAIQRDQSLWDKPEEFLPERFQNNSIDFEGQNFELIPFGVGRRICPGLKFAEKGIEYIVANLLYWFDWKLPGEDLDMSEIYGLSVHKKIPLHLIPIPYSP